jgi:hypothetical protein
MYRNVHAETTIHTFYFCRCQSVSCSDCSTAAVILFRILKIMTWKEVTLLSNISCNGEDVSHDKTLCYLLYGARMGVVAVTSSGVRFVLNFIQCGHLFQQLKLQSTTWNTSLLLRAVTARRVVLSSQEMNAFRRDVTYIAICFIANSQILVDLKFQVCHISI